MAKFTVILQASAQIEVEADDRDGAVDAAFVEVDNHKLEHEWYVNYVREE